MSRKLLLPVVLVLALACGLPSQGSSNPPTGENPAANEPALPSGRLQILSPQNGATISGGPLQVQFATTGGPFIQVYLLVEGAMVSFLPQDGISESTSGLLSWASPTTGLHTIVVEAQTTNKETLSASIQITVADGLGDTPLAPPPPAQEPPAPSSGAPGSAFVNDPGYAAARARIIQILHDDYQLNVTAPPVGRKDRKSTRLNSSHIQKSRMPSSA